MSVTVAVWHGHLSGVITHSKVKRGYIKDVAHTHTQTLIQYGLCAAQ